MQQYRWRRLNHNCLDLDDGCRIDDHHNNNDDVAADVYVDQFDFIDPATDDDR